MVGNEQWRAAGTIPCRNHTMAPVRPPSSKHRAFLGNPLIFEPAISEKCFDQSCAILTRVSIMTVCRLRGSLTEGQGERNGTQLLMIVYIQLGSWVTKKGEWRLLVKDGDMEMHGHP